MTVSPFTLSGVHCPSCGKHTVVEHKPSVYRCLNCDFEKDLSKEPEPEDAGWLQMLMGAASVLLLAALAL